MAEQSDLDIIADLKAERDRRTAATRESCIAASAAAAFRSDGRRAKICRTLLFA